MSTDRSPRFFLVCIACVAAFHAQAQATELRLGSASLSLSLDSELDYCLTSLSREGGSDAPLAIPTAQRSLSPWLIRVRRGNGRYADLVAGDAGVVSHSRKAQSIAVHWRDVTSRGMGGALQVTMTVRLDGTSGKSRWRLQVDGDIAGVLWWVEFPRVFGVRGKGNGRLAMPHYWGRLLRDPIGLRARRSLTYPSPGSMQFMAFWQEAEGAVPPSPPELGVAESGWLAGVGTSPGLYWATEDGAGCYKQFLVDAATDADCLNFSVRHFPPVTKWPVAPDERSEVSYAPSYETVIAPCAGDWQRAANAYLEWARDQQWCSGGVLPPTDPPTDARVDSEMPPSHVPSWFRKIGFWAKFYHEPAKVLPEWAAYRKWLRVPMASHYYRYNIAAFDDNYPDHLPADPYLTEGIRAARQMGVRPLPYINGVIWDTDTQSWLLENGLAAAVLDPEGQLHPWDIHGEVFAYMCPSAASWHAKMRETVEKLVWEHGAAGVYLDCLAATRARLCYSTEHGHQAHGGNYQAGGNRRLLSELREHIRSLRPQACFFTEQINELYLDRLDGFLTLDLSRSYCPPGEQVIPLFTAVYHPYMINFGGDCSLDLPPDFLAWQLGTHVVWGAQPLFSTTPARAPRAGDPNSEYLREVVQAYWRAARRFVIGGERMAIATHPFDVPRSATPIDVAVAPHTVSYNKQKDRRTTWYGPAVLCSAWRQGSEVAITMVNVSTEEQAVQLNLRLGALDLTSAQLHTAWPIGADPDHTVTADGQTTVTIPSRTMRVLVLTPTPEPALQAAELDSMAWELITVETGEFRAHTVTGSRLWACDDCPVSNRREGDSMTARPISLEQSGEPVPRRGRQANVRGAAAEGRALPRERDEQPFMLLRQTLVEVSGGEEVIVLSGTDEHMLCVAPPGTELRFARPGLLVARLVSSGEIVRSPAAPMTRSWSVLQNGSCLVAYASIGFRNVRRVMTEAPDLARKVQELLDLADALVGPPGPPRADALASLSRACAEAIRAQADRPGALAPGAALPMLSRTVNALVSAMTGLAVRLDADDDWLAPGVPKAVRLNLGYLTQGTRDVGIPLIHTGGDHRTCSATRTATNDALSPHRRTAAFTVLYDGEAERVQNVSGDWGVTMDGREFALTSLLGLEANRPLDLRLPSRPTAVVAGGSETLTCAVRNWSPSALTVSFSVDAPPGWALKVDPPQRVLPGRDAAFRVTMAIPKRWRRGIAELTCRASYAGVDKPYDLLGVAAINVVDALVPWRPGPRPEVTQSKGVRSDRAVFRTRARLVLYPDPDLDTRVLIRNVRVTRYVDDLDFTLLSPSLKPIATGKIPVDGEESVPVPATEAGAHFLLIAPRAGSAEVVVDGARWAEVATKQDPLILFCSPVKRFFLVPPEARAFGLAAVDGGPDETARIIVASPTGRVALDRDGRWDGEDIAVAIRPGEDGGVWSVECVPQQDVSLWLTGEACPYLGSSIEDLLVPSAFAPQSR